MAIYYEWDIETSDVHGDIVDHHHADQLRDLPALGERQMLVLVWNDGDELDGLVDRTWAYVQDGKLPEFFLGDGHRVPKRFHAELARSGRY